MRDVRLSYSTPTNFVRHPPRAQRPGQSCGELRRSQPRGGSARRARRARHRRRSEREAVAARALEFLILAAARTGEVIGARWNEIDLLDKVWTVPAARMKAYREHRVPLSARALAVLEEMQPLRRGNNPDPFVFPGPRPGKPLSNMAFLMLLRRMELNDLTVHGFRATFKTWASERTSFQNEIVEASLAHIVGGKVEQAYMRGDLFEKRRRLMQQWATFCMSTPTTNAQKIVPLRAS